MSKDKEWAHFTLAGTILPELLRCIGFSLLHDTATSVHLSAPQLAAKLSYEFADALLDEFLSRSSRDSQASPTPSGLSESDETTSSSSELRNINREVEVRKKAGERDDMSDKEQSGNSGDSNMRRVTKEQLWDAVHTIEMHTTPPPTPPEAPL